MIPDDLLAHGVVVGFIDGLEGFAATSVSGRCHFSLGCGFVDSAEVFATDAVDNSVNDIVLGVEAADDAAHKVEWSVGQVQPDVADKEIFEPLEPVVDAFAVEGQGVGHGGD